MGVGVWVIEQELDAMGSPYAERGAMGSSYAKRGAITDESIAIMN